MAKGYYSVVQYNPDPSRAEAANIGVVLLRPGEKSRVYAKGSETLSRVKTFFKPGKDRLWRIGQALGSNATRLAAQCSTVDELTQFTRTLANDRRMTAPMVVRVDDPVATLDPLFVELEALRVAEVLPRAINDVFVDLVRQNKVRRPGRITVPLMHRKIDVPYAYQNGVLNLVKPATIPHKVSVSDSTIRLAVEGDLINTVKVEGHDRRLIVVSAASNRAEDEQRAAALFKQYNVRFVTQDQAEAFADQVRLEAK